MKCLLFILLFFAPTVHAQTFAIFPDSGAVGTEPKVTITGGGTHFFDGTRSTVSVNIEASGKSLWANGPGATFNDSVITSSFYIPHNLDTGWYDVSVICTDTAHPYVYRSVHAFYASASLTKVVGLQPSKGFQGESLADSVYGYWCGFDPDGDETIFFIQHGDTIFSARPTLVFAADTMRILINIPASAPVGMYDIGVKMPLGRTAFGEQLFEVVGSAGVSNSTDAHLSISANCSNGILNVRFSLARPQHIRLVVMDELGRTLSTLRNNECASGIQNIQCSAAHLPFGTYFYELTTEDGLATGKVEVSP